MKTKQVLNLSQFLYETKMSLGALSLLAAVSENPNQNIGNLATIVGMSTASASIHVKKLQKNRFLIKTSSTEDERVTFVNLTKFGEEFLVKALAFINETNVAAKSTTPVKKAVTSKKKVVAAAQEQAENTAEPVAA